MSAILSSQEVGAGCVIPFNIPEAKVHRHGPGIICQACMTLGIDMKDVSFRELSFTEAAPIWLRTHSRYIKSRTVRDYEQYIKALEKFFGAMVLQEISVINVRAYQEWRGATAGNSRINMECSTLQQILKEARLWKKMGELYRPLPISQKGSGKSANKAEIESLLVIAFSRPKWRLAAHSVRIMLRSGFGWGELRWVKRRDVDIGERTITVLEGAKNNARERTFPFMDETWESVQWLLNRWEELGGRNPDDYLLPHCSSRRNGPRDFSRPMLTIKRAWAGMRKEWGKNDFRMYDCRVTAVTRALSSGRVSIHTAEKLFGHVSQAMQRRYYKPQLDTLREAAKVLEDKSA